MRATKAFAVARGRPQNSLEAALERLRNWDESRGLSRRHRGYRCPPSGPAESRRTAIGLVLPGIWTYEPRPLEMLENTLFTCLPTIERMTMTTMAIRTRMSAY
jgi:hypothetical protein